jgi:transcriptional regulator with XRE-family HTH domain
MQVIRWRKSNKLSLSQMAERLGIGGRNPSRTYQRYETGENRPDADTVQKIIEMTAGAVTAQDMHETRLAWLRERAVEQ